MTTAHHDLRRALALCPCVALLVLLGCADDGDAGHKLAEREFRDYQLVYPVLLRDCGFHACHGAEERFFRVWGPGRMRLDPDTSAYDALTGDEASESFESAVAMLDPDHPERSPLLRKPLALAAGGSAHGGEDDFGRNVYRTVNDEGYLTIARFVFAQPDPPAEE